jgi:glycerophosphoryl diester phosphodiesterase
VVEDGMKDRLIGHRGEPETWPENSLAGFEAVLAAAARYIETDVQLTADGIPILSHDPSLLRVTGQNIIIPETEYETVRAVPAGYQERFGSKYRHFRIARLDEFVALLQQWPLARAFVELKHASLKAHGQPRVLETVMNTIRPVESQCILISFDYDALVYTREHYGIPTGWVVPEWSDSNHVRASELGPAYLFCNHKRLPADAASLWQGPWQWAIYTVNNAGEAKAYLEWGIQLVETNIIRQLMSASGTGDPGHD